MPEMVKSPKLKTYGPFVLMNVLHVLITHLDPFSGRWPLHTPVVNSTKSALNEAPILVAAPVLSRVPETLRQYGTATKPSTWMFPTPTTPVQAPSSILTLLFTMLVGFSLLLSTLLAAPHFYGHRSCRRLIGNAMKQILSAIVISSVLLRWPSLQEYPIDEICVAVLHLLRAFLTRLQQDIDDLPDIEENWGTISVDYPVADIGISKDKARTSVIAFRKVEIVLQRRADASLWVVRFDQPTRLEDILLEECPSEIQKLTTGNPETIDMAHILTKFIAAPDFVPSAPWRVLGIHNDPIEISSSPTDNRGPSMYPLDQGHAAEHFSYSRSHDPRVELETEDLGSSLPFWDSSAEAQALAWSLIGTQSCATGPNTPPVFYSIEPQVAWIELVAALEAERQERMEERRRRRNEELAERLRIQREEGKERRARNRALWKMKMKKFERWLDQWGPGPSWRDPGRLRPRRNLS